MSQRILDTVRPKHVRNDTIENTRSSLLTLHTVNQSAFGHQMQSVRRRVAEAFDLPEGTAVVLAASGTDAEYVPLAIARELQHLAETDASPGAIHSVLVAAEEVGGASTPVNHN